MGRAISTVLRHAALPYQGEPSFYAWLRSSYSQRRKLMAEALEEVGIRTVEGQGGIFLLGDIRGLYGADGPLGASWEKVRQPDEAIDWTCCRALAAELGIVSLPVSPFFGADTPEEVRTGFARFCFAKTTPTLEEAARRLHTLRRK